MSTPAPPDPALKRAWRRNQRWICALLAVWFVVTFVVSWFARDLRFDFFGWPFSFWMGAQGALVVYVLMTALYAWRMNRSDDEADEGAADAPQPSPDMNADAGKDAA